MIKLVYLCLIVNCICLILSNCEALPKKILKTYNHIRTKSSSSEQKESVIQLIKRLIPAHASKFIISIHETYVDSEFADYFEIVSTTNGSIKIIGSTGVAAAAGFYHYLKYWCFAHISWSGNHLNIPTNLPFVHSPVKKVFYEKFRYYQNVCTVSYSMVFWNWTRWEQEIDWMAMNGINFPLAFTGQESVWQIVYKKFGLTQDELDEHFSGPAFLAWQRMGNLEGWGGPLSSSWYSKQLQLQQNIISRMRSFGMIPVLPGFGGHIPKALVNRLFPTSKYYKLKPWNKFTGKYGETFLLDPQDPLFKKVGAAFVEMQKQLYNGTDHVYNADIFNEMDPPQLTSAFITNTSIGVYNAMLASDSDAVWLMQGWMFLSSVWKPELIKAWLQAIPYGKLIILDLASDLYPLYDQTNAFYGHPFIWCMIENFGGTTRLYGQLTGVMKGVISARKTYKSFMIGTGMTPEGINQNDINFELMNEMGWRNEEFNISDWTLSYIKRRYGDYPKMVSDAWLILIDTIYNCNDGIENGGYEGRIPVMRPRLNAKLPVHMWYSVKDLYNAWKLMVKGSDYMPLIDTFRNDLVRLGTQVLEDLSIMFYTQMVSGYFNKSTLDVEKYGSKITVLLTDMDRLLATDQYSLLGRWIQSARSMGDTLNETKLLEYNAKNQITFWGPNGEIHDYANKNWAGLVGSFYFERWNIFINFLSDSLKRDVPYDDSAFVSKVLQFEKEWNDEIKEFSADPTGDAFDISHQLLRAYEKVFESEISMTVFKKAFKVPDTPLLF